MGHTITVRGLEDELHAQLKERARANHRSMEAEARALLAAGVRAPAVDLSRGDTGVGDWIDRARAVVSEAWQDGDDDWLPERATTPSRRAPELGG